MAIDESTPPVDARATRRTPAPPHPAHPRPSAGLTLAAVAIVQFLVSLDLSVVNVGLPEIAKGLGFSPVGLTWVIHAYALTFGGLLLLGGKATDRYGRRRVLLIGLGVFGVASLLGGFAQAPSQLVAARAAQGVGAAMLAPAALATLTARFPSGRERVRAMGIWSATNAAGGALGVLIGGVATEYASWRWVMFVSVPMAAVAAVLAHRGVARDRTDGERSTPDVVGAVLGTGGMTLLVFGIVRTEQVGWMSTSTAVTLACALGLLGVFALAERRTRREPLVRLSLFANRAVTGANAYNLLLGAAMASSFYFMSLYLQRVLGAGPALAGLQFVPLALGVIVGSALAIKLGYRVTPRTLLVGGGLLTAAGFAWFSRISTDGSFLVDVLGPSILVSVGFGLCLGPLVSTATSTVAEADAGMASGLLNSSRQIGASLGLAVLGTAAHARTGESPTPGALTDGYALGLGLGAVLFLVAVLIALTVLRTPASLVRPHVPALAVVVALQVVGALAGLAPLLAVVELARMLLGPGPVDDGRAWTVVVLGAVGLLVRLVLTGVSSGLGHLLDARVQLALRRRLAGHLARTPMGWLSQRSTGELTKLVGDDVAAVHPFIAHTPGMLASAVVVPLASLVYLLSVSWQMTLVTLIPVACAVAVVPLFMTPARVHEQEEFDAAMNRLSNVALEFVQGIAVVKSLSGSHRAPRRFLTATDRFVDTFRRWVVGLSAPAAAMQLALSPPFVILVILVGGTVLIGRNSVAPADLLPFLLLGLGLTAPVAALGHGFDDLQAARAAVGRIRETLGVAPLPEPSAPRRPQGHRVELRDVRFAYGEREVLRGIDLDLAPGTTTALVGPSGGGKSTLVQLLPRFFDPSHGSVQIGGVDLRDIATEDLYRSVSFVFQDVRLLRTSVADNIALAVPEANHDDIVRAARLAQIHDRILALPRGYGSVVGDDARLSGGEAQRLALARALLADTPVIVLDEATSYADPQTERAVREALAAWQGHRTILLIAHRPDTAAGADTVVVLDAGAIVEQGDPSALLSRGGALAALWAPSDQRPGPATNTPQPEGGSR